MGAPSTSHVRNVVLVGQGGVGKTSLAEAFLHLSGKTARLGTTENGKPTMDYDPEEMKRKFSISTAIAPIEHKGFKINVLDAPCYPDFIGDAYAAMSVCETALFVVDATTGPQATTIKLWYAAQDLKLARAVFVNRIDKEGADFELTMEMLKERFGQRLGAVNIPLGSGEDFKGVIDILRMKARYFEDGNERVEEIPQEYLQQAEQARDALCDLVAEADEELMMKYLEGEEHLSQDELEKLLGKAIAERIFVPVYVGSTLIEQGVSSLMDDIVSYFPSPLDYGSIGLSDGTDLKIQSLDARPVFFVFKTLSDPYVGRLSFVKVLAGTINGNTELINARTQKKERLNHLHLMTGKESTEIKEAQAGDIIVIPKLNDAKTGDTFSYTGEIEAKAFNFSNSLYRVAIAAKDRNDEDKLGDFLTKAIEADPTLALKRDEETHQTIISAIGEAQITVLLERLKERSGIEAELLPLRIPYRETIRKSSSAQGRHKKQTGGSGQFGDCWLRLEPNPGAGYEFVDEIVGGKIPKQFLPAVDKGCQMAMEEGILAGYPMVDVKVACYDGSYHSVDSNEMAFKMAGRLAFRNAADKAEIVILEPMAQLAITVPEDYAGTIMGDISASRGRINGMESDDRGNTVIRATAPYAELVDYSTKLRSLSRGTGEYSLELEGYEQVPYDTAEKLIEDYRKSREEASK